MAAAAGVVAAAAAAAAIKKKRDEQAIAIVAAWDVFRAVAAAHGLHDPPPPSSSQSLPSAEGDLHGVACRVAIELDEQGWAHTAVTAPPLYKNVFEIAVAPSPRGALAFVKRLFSERGASVGDPDFDRAFLVHAEPAEMAPILLTPAIREVISGFAGHGLTVFQAAPTGVVLQWNGVERDTGVLAAALDLVVTAGRWRDSGVAAYR